MHELDPTLSQPAQESLPQETANAMSAIGAVGGAAMIGEVAPPAQISQSSSKPGFLHRRLSAIKERIFDNDSAVEAITAAGGEFTAWETARVLLRKQFIDAPQGWWEATKHPFQTTRAHSHRSLSTEKMASGVNSRTLRRKMAEATEGPRNRQNPVTRHLSQYSRQTTREVAREREKMRWKRARGRD